MSEYVKEAEHQIRAAAARYGRVPKFGFTKHGRAVHADTLDHLPEDSRYARFNKAVAIWLTKNVGTMSCFWLVFLLCSLALPAVLLQMNVIDKTAFIIGTIATPGFYLLLTWMISTTFQAILLPALLVGQNLQNEAADARAAKTFEDVEDVKNSVATAVDRLDTNTQGGIKVLLDLLNERLPAKA